MCVCNGIKTVFAYVVIVIECTIMMVCIPIQNDVLHSIHLQEKSNTPTFIGDFFTVFE
jgi:hypothetical protein